MNFSKAEKIYKEISLLTHNEKITLLSKLKRIMVDTAPIIPVSKEYL